MLLNAGCVSIVYARTHFVCVYMELWNVCVVCRLAFQCVENGAQSGKAIFISIFFLTGIQCILLTTTVHFSPILN